VVTRLTTLTHRRLAGFVHFDYQGNHVALKGSSPQPTPFTIDEALDAVTRPGIVPVAMMTPAAAKPVLAAGMVWPSWAQRAPPTPGPIVNLSVAASGWPMLSLGATSWVNQIPLGREVRGGLRFKSSPPWTNGVLPLTPLWPGSLVDVSLYSALWWCLITGLVLARIRLRRRRGLCPACAYDLRHDHASGCPECGWGRTPGPSRSAVVIAPRRRRPALTSRVPTGPAPASD
jgi:hypothetical protein